MFPGLRLMLTLWVLVSPAAVYAVSYQPPLFHRQYDHEAFLPGDTVYLFHSSAAVTRKVIHAHDVIPVYRIDESCRMREVGRIRVVSYVGETYLKAEVVDGEVAPNDVAKKNGFSCLVISAETCGR